MHNMFTIERVHSDPLRTYIRMIKKDILTQGLSR